MKMTDFHSIGEEAAIIAFGDPLESFLKSVSPEYVESSRQKAESFLNAKVPDRAVLRFGYAHPVYTSIARELHCEVEENDNPTYYTGWVIRARISLKRRTFIECAKDLYSSSPKLILGSIEAKGHEYPATIDDMQTLDLAEFLSTSDPSAWQPSYRVANTPLNARREPVFQMALALKDLDFQKADVVSSIARDVYSAWGYRIFSIGYSFWRGAAVRDGGEGL